MKVLVIGGSGLVGSNVVDVSARRDVDVVATYHSSETEHTDVRLDKAEHDETRAVVDDVDPDAVIDTAAWHDVDSCEDNRGKAWSVNAQGTRNVATAAAEVDAHYVYVSTDYVFPGDPGHTPYTESDPVRPVNYYGQTKYAGEQAAKIPDRWTVLRTSVIYGLNKPNFATWALSELREGASISIVDDQTSTPTYAPDLARACVDVVSEELFGLYHATGPTSLSRYEFTRILADVHDLDPELVAPITTEALGQQAPRPTDGSLDARKLYDRIGWTFEPPEKAFRSMAESS